MMEIDITACPATGTAGAFLKLPSPSAVEISRMLPQDASDVTSRMVRNERALETIYAIEGEIEHDDEAIRISPRAYLRSMFTILASCFTDPFSATVVDLTTGKKVPEDR